MNPAGTRLNLMAQQIGRRGRDNNGSSFFVVCVEKPTDNARRGRNYFDRSSGSRLGLRHGE